jgi:hypothetical protein
MKAKARVNSPKKKQQAPNRDGREWQRLYEEMRKERGRLRKELAAVKKERDAYLKAVYALMPKEDIDFDKKEMLSRLGQGTSPADLIAEIESQGAA